MVKENDKVREIIEKFCINANSTVEEIVNSLKEDSKTYGELIRKVEMLKKRSLWYGKIIGKNIEISLFDECIELIKREMNDLTIVIHS